MINGLTEILDACIERLVLEKIIFFLGAQSEEHNLNVREVPGFIPILFTKQIYLRELKIIFYTVNSP
jgi:hypothetical protein